MGKKNDSIAIKKERDVFESLSDEEMHNLINQHFKLRWGENHCCPHLVIVSCVEGSPHKHLGCEISIDRGDGIGIDNAHAAITCIGKHEDGDCPIGLGTASISIRLASEEQSSH